MKRRLNEMNRKKEGGDSSNDQKKEDDNVYSTNNVNTASDGNNTNNINAVSSTVNAAGIEGNAVGTKTSIELLDDPNMPELEDIVYSDDAKDVVAKANKNNLNTFMPIRMKQIRLFLAYASYKDFVVYQMDVKSAFLYCRLKRKVYVCQTNDLRSDFLCRYTQNRKDTLWTASMVMDIQEKDKSQSQQKR
ncbi:putative ribonuclease H-like domain-containing protein [Tanacetum coccineum]